MDQKIKDATKCLLDAGEKLVADKDMKKEEFERIKKVLHIVERKLLKSDVSYDKKKEMIEAC